MEVKLIDSHALIEAPPWVAAGITIAQWLAKQAELFAVPRPGPYAPFGPLCDPYSGPGIYFLYAGKDLFYIGKAANISRRLRTHSLEGRVRFDGASFVHCVFQPIVDAITG